MTMKGPNNQMRSRVVFLTLAFVIVGFGLVAARLLYMQVFHYGFYEQQAKSLQTRDAIVTPNRGTIFDANMQELAKSASTEKVTVNPKGVISESKVKNGISEETQQQTLAAILSDVLELNYDTVLEKIQRTDTAYQVIAEKIDKETMKELYAALEDKECTGVYPEPDTKRYYKYGSYLSAVLGYVDGDNKGVIGLESEYESELAGTAGRIVRAQNAKNQDMPYDYEQYIPATDGNSIVLSIDSDIQSYLEKHLETALADNPDAKEGVSGIVVDVKTGAVLAMASLPDFDPNQPRVITGELYLNKLRTNVAAILEENGVSAEIPDAYYEKGGMENLPDSVKSNDKLVKEIGDARLDVLNQMWRNPVIMDTYEPGSTFKLMNVATAYELGLVHDNDTFVCTGSMTVGDWKDPIKCWRWYNPHGAQNLTEALMNSCNVAMMQIAFKTGLDRFYDFYKAFGLNDKTGIDLPSESNSLFHNVNDSTAWNEVSLAVAAFGQRFNVTPIQMINMVSAIVDDGRLKKPYVVKEVLNADGSVKSTTETTVIRQVISAETSAFMRQAMQEVVQNGTGKNAYVAGYRVGGKTATSELIRPGESENRYTASFIGVAPMDDPQIAVLVAVQNLPESMPHGGGLVAAPVVGRIMEDVLPYIGVTPVYSEEENDRREASVPNVIGSTEEQAAATLSQSGLSYRVVGDGDKVTDQVPAGGVRIPASGSVILYMGGVKPTEQITVPDLTGLDPTECRDRLAELGLYMKRKGIATAQTTGETVASKQNPVADTKVSIGSVITIDFANSTDIGD